MAGLFELGNRIAVGRADAREAVEQAPRVSVWRQVAGCTKIQDPSVPPHHYFIAISMYIYSTESDRIILVANYFAPGAAGGSYSFRHASSIIPYYQ
jgi:hypothetical protein